MSDIDWSSRAEAVRRRVLRSGSAALLVGVLLVTLFGHNYWIPAAAVGLLVLWVAYVYLWLVRPTRNAAGDAEYVVGLAPGRLWHDGQHLDESALARVDANRVSRGRLHVSKEELRFRVGDQPVIFTRDMVSEVDLKMVQTFPPLGYLDIVLNHGGRVQARVYQPKRVARQLETWPQRGPLQRLD